MFFALKDDCIKTAALRQHNNIEATVEQRSRRDDTVGIFRSKDICRVAGNVDVAVVGTFYLWLIPGSMPRLSFSLRSSSFLRKIDGQWRYNSKPHSIPITPSVGTFALAYYLLRNK